MAFSNAGKNVMLDALGAVAVYVSLHTASPGTTGANEVSGGGYSRQTVTWFAASAGDLDNNANPSFTVPAGTTITHFGLWSASTAGTFYCGDVLSANETFTGSGTYTLTDLDVTIP